MRNSNGFTLIEVLAAMFVMVMGVMGVMGLIGRTVAFNSSVNSQFVASYLAQEGLEIVRNMRDANFLKIHKGVGEGWADGLTCENDCRVDYISDSLVPKVDEKDFLLYRDQLGMYSYPSPNVNRTLPPCESYGDVNLNGNIDENDSQLILGYRIGSVYLTEEQKENADVNNDNKITSADVSLIMQYHDGLRDTFPVCATKFFRTVSTDLQESDKLIVEVDVSWQDKGNTRTVRGATELYNWLNPTPAP